MGVFWLLFTLASGTAFVLLARDLLNDESSEPSAPSAADVAEDAAFEIHRLATEGTRRMIDAALADRQVPR